MYIIVTVIYRKIRLTKYGFRIKKATYEGESEFENTGDKIDRLKYLTGSFYNLYPSEDIFQYLIFRL